MEQNQIESANEWAVRTYGTVKLGHFDRTQRAVKIASALARDPMSSIPKQMETPAATKATYRFLESAKTSNEALITPHIEQTRAMMHQRKRVPLIQDMTEVDYTHHPKTHDLGPVGKGNHHQGYLLQTVLAVDPTSRQVMGIAAQEAFLRHPAPEGETSHERDKRLGKESEVWARQAREVGPAPAEWKYIHMGDRGSDLFAFLQECLQLNCGFEVRVKHNRRVDLLVDQAQRPVLPGARRHGKQRSATHEPPQHLFEVVRSWPEMGQETIQLDANHKRKAREATLVISWGTLRLWPPDGEAGKEALPMVVTLVRTWEPNPPAGAEALEWLLVTSVAVKSQEDTWERVQWYRMRWIVEDYHQCLKTGCEIEARQMQPFEGLRTMLGFLAPLAVRLLQLRDVARQDPERAAQEIATINQAARQQSQSSNTLVQIMQGVSASTLQNTSSTRTVEQSIERLAHLAQQLQASVGAFKLREMRNNRTGPTGGRNIEGIAQNGQRRLADSQPMIAHAGRNGRAVNTAPIGGNDALNRYPVPTQSQRRDNGQRS